MKLQIIGGLVFVFASIFAMEPDKNPEDVTGIQKKCYQQFNYDFSSVAQEVADRVGLESKADVCLYGRSFIRDICGEPRQIFFGEMGKVRKTEEATDTFSRSFLTEVTAQLHVIETFGQTQEKYQKLVSVYKGVIVLNYMAFTQKIEIQNPKNGIFKLIESWQWPTKEFEPKNTYTFTCRGELVGFEKNYGPAEF